METVNAIQCRKDLFPILDRAVRDNERFVVTTENGNAVIVSEETWNGLVEAAYILSDPKMLTSIEMAESEYPDGCVEWTECLKAIERSCPNIRGRIRSIMSGNASRKNEGEGRNGPRL